MWCAQIIARFLCYERCSTVVSVPHVVLVPGYYLLVPPPLYIYS